MSDVHLSGDVKVLIAQGRWLDAARKHVDKTGCSMIEAQEAILARHPSAAFPELEHHAAAAEQEGEPDGVAGDDLPGPEG